MPGDDYNAVLLMSLRGRIKTVCVALMRAYEHREQKAGRRSLAHHQDAQLLGRVAAEPAARGGDDPHRRAVVAGHPDLCADLHAQVKQTVLRMSDPDRQIDLIVRMLLLLYNMRHVCRSAA